MHFTVANHNTVSPNGFEHYDTVEFSDIPQMVTSGYCYCACKLKNNYRKDDNFDGNVDVLIIDIDEKCTIDQAKMIFKPYRFFLITTKSHQIDKGGLTCDRFRMFIELASTQSVRVTVENIYKSFIDRFPFVDEKCRNVSRFFYASPSNSRIIYNEGKKYSTNIPICVNPMGVERETKAQPISEVKIGKIYVYNELIEKWQTDCGHILEEDNHNKEENKLKGITNYLDSDFYQGNKSCCLFNAGCMMKKDGFDDDFIIDHLMKEWELRSSQTDKFKDALSNIKNSLSYN